MIGNDSLKFVSLPIINGERILWVDVAKGIGILLVIWGHTRWCAFIWTSQGICGLPTYNAENSLTPILSSVVFQE